MQGGDKALISIAGKPMIEWVIERLRPQVDAVLINANSRDVAAAMSAYTVIADSVQGFQGPLAGLHAGMARADTAMLACVPCDAPMLPDNLIVHLHRALVEASADIAIARTAGGLQPTFLLCQCNLQVSIEMFLAQGKRAFHLWLAQQNCIEVLFSDELAFSNVNTPEDLARVLALLNTR